MRRRCAVHEAKDQIECSATETVAIYNYHFYGIIVELPLCDTHFRWIDKFYREAREEAQRGK